MRVLCTGPESSGTRLLTRLADGFVDVEAEHRSLPHAGEWPTYAYAREFDAVLVSVRSMWPTVNSAVAAGHARHMTEALTKYVESMDWIGGLMLARERVAGVTYEDVAVRGLPAVAEALALVGHPKPTRWEGSLETLGVRNSKWSNLSVEVVATSGTEPTPDHPKESPW